jgi:hypothetical protein
MKARIILEELFFALTVSILVFGVLELIRPRLVLAYINLDWLVLAWLFASAYLLFTNKNK